MYVIDIDDVNMLNKFNFRDFVLSLLLCCFFDVYYGVRVTGNCCTGYSRDLTRDVNRDAHATYETFHK